MRNQWVADRWGSAAIVSRSFPWVATLDLGNPGPLLGLGPPEVGEKCTVEGAALLSSCTRRNGRQGLVFCGRRMGRDSVDVSDFRFVPGAANHCVS
jgi:hypothetical protein